MNNVDPNYPNNTKIQFKFALIEAIASYELYVKHLAKNQKEAFGMALLASYRTLIRNASKLDEKQVQSLERLFAVFTAKNLSDYYGKALYLIEDIDSKPDVATAVLSYADAAIDTDINSFMSPYVFTDSDYSLGELVYCVVVIEKSNLLKEDEGAKQSKTVKKILASAEISEETKKLINYTIRVDQQ